MLQPIPCPTIHLGGTSGDALLLAAMKARQAVDDAVETMSEAAPNRRDYIGRDSDWKLASDAHKQRCAMLRELSRLCDEEMAAINHAMAERQLAAR